MFCSSPQEQRSRITLTGNSGIFGKSSCLLVLFAFLKTIGSWFPQRRMGHSEAFGLAYDHPVHCLLGPGRCPLQPPGRLWPSGYKGPLSASSPAENQQAWLSAHLLSSSSKGISFQS